MGTPKALLDWHGAPLLARVAGVLQQACDPVFVVAAPGQELPPLPAGVAVVTDERPGRGPLQGIAAGLRAAAPHADAAYVSGTDVPLLHPRFVARVVAALAETGADAAVPEVDGRLHPLAAAYRTSLLPAVEALLAADRLAVTALCESPRAVRLGRDDLLADRALAAADPALDSLRNLNTPGDYRRALGGRD